MSLEFFQFYELSSIPQWLSSQFHGIPTPLCTVVKISYLVISIFVKPCNHFSGLKRHYFWRQINQTSESWLFRKEIFHPDGKYYKGRGICEFCLFACLQSGWARSWRNFLLHGSSVVFASKCLRRRFALSKVNSDSYNPTLFEIIGTPNLNYFTENIWRSFIINKDN